MIAVILGAIGFVSGIVCIVIARKKQLKPDQPPLYLGTAISVLILAVVFIQVLMAPNAPIAMHNISTDRQDPPAFDAVVALRGETANPLEYDVEKLAEAQLQAYPEVQTLETNLDRSASFERAVAVIEAMGLELVHADEDAGMVEATAETFWFGFKDDMVVRLRAAAAGTIVDVRSVSRVGQSDLGANARRILEFLKRFQSS